jgi:2-polyprenyl-6-hydroxyphenyl methylase/3-demethylubiquinone-9 3-methyltransferase
MQLKLTTFGMITLSNLLAFSFQHLLTQERDTRVKKSDQKTVMAEQIPASHHDSNQKRVYQSNTNENTASEHMSKHNVDRKEIGKFDDLARKWWDKTGEFKPLHDINPLRMAYITDRVPLKNKRVLDVGCGGGILSESLAQAGAVVSAIDMAEKPLQVAKLHQYESNTSINYELTTIEEHAENNAAEYDIITCLEMIEHVPDPASIIKACRRLLKPDGHLFLSTINRGPKAYLLMVIGAEYILNMLPRGTHDYDKFIKPSELANWLRQEEFTLSDVSGMTYNPISKKYTLSGDTDVNYLVHARSSSH